MLVTETVTKLDAICEEVVGREGYELYDVELTGRGGSQILRVYIDSSSSSIGIEDCTKVSRALNLRLDVEDLIATKYTLEVSSPGLQRHLNRDVHFDKVIGNEIVLKVKKAFAEYGLTHRSKKRSKQARVLLKSTREKEIVVELAEEEMVIPRGDLIKANVFYDFDKARASK